MRRYHFSTWGNGPHTGRLVQDSLELCTGRDCTYDHVVVLTESQYDFVIDAASDELGRDAEEAITELESR